MTQGWDPISTKCPKCGHNLYQSNRGSVTLYECQNPHCIRNKITLDNLPQLIHMSDSQAWSYVQGCNPNNKRDSNLDVKPDNPFLNRTFGGGDKSFSLKLVRQVIHRPITRIKKYK